MRKVIATVIIIMTHMNISIAQTIWNAKSVRITMLMKIKRDGAGGVKNVKTKSESQRI